MLGDGSRKKQKRSKEEKKKITNPRGRIGSKRTQVGREKGEW